MRIAQVAPLHERVQQLTEMGDPLVGLNAVIDWEVFRPDLNRVHEKERKSNAGAKPFDVVLMFRLLILQQLHNLSDDGIEYQVRDRLSFMRFLGLQLEDRVPDAKTVWLYRERLKALNLVDVLFARFHEQLATQGYVARAGQMIDATFVEVPRQRNSREENAKIKAGEIPEGWGDAEAKAKRSQKDTDARWTKKNDKTHTATRTTSTQPRRLCFCASSDPKRLYPVIIRIYRQATTMSCASPSRYSK